MRNFVNIVTRITRNFAGYRTNAKKFGLPSALGTLHQFRTNTTVAAVSSTQDKFRRRVNHVIPITVSSTKVIWEDSLAADIHYLWLRDNCRCPKCVHPETGQKLFDITRVPLDMVRPNTMKTTDDGGSIKIVWDNDGHESIYDSQWLRDSCPNFFVSTDKEANISSRPQEVEWTREIINADSPFISYDKALSNDGLLKWLSSIHKYGVAIMTDTPIENGFVMEVANKIAYVKETSYGRFFDVIVEPRSDAHLAYSSVGLDHHTDMNYREKSPGLQMLHCLKNDQNVENPGGRSFFVDGLHVVNWLKKTNPVAFHTLCSIDVEFQMITNTFKYRQQVPIICLDKKGDFAEIHVNNRTMAPVQAPKDIIGPFYSAYNLLMEKIRDPKLEFTFNLQPGDLVAFNNRRVLHGRSAFNSHKISRHLQGCYVDYDEMLSKLDILNLN